MGVGWELVLRRLLVLLPLRYCHQIPSRSGIDGRHSGVPWRQSLTFIDCCLTSPALAVAVAVAVFAVTVASPNHLYLADRWHRLHLASTLRRRGESVVGESGWGAVHAHWQLCFVVLLSGLLCSLHCYQFATRCTLRSARKLGECWKTI